VPSDFFNNIIFCLSRFSTESMYGVGNASGLFFLQSK
jgi:hypothetical protein